MTKPDNVSPSPSSNPDPITGAPGSHPVGTGAGAAAGGVAGAAVGAFAGPVGALAGAAIGAVVGGLGGKGVAEAIDPTVEDAYWRQNHHNADGHTYDEYAPAYRAGYTNYRDDLSFDQNAETIRADYERSAKASTPAGPVTQWADAQRPARAAYDRIAARRAAGSTLP